MGGSPSGHWSALASRDSAPFGSGDHRSCPLCHGPTRFPVSPPFTKRQAYHEATTACATLSAGEWLFRSSLYLEFIPYGEPDCRGLASSDVQDLVCCPIYCQLRCRVRPWQAPTLPHTLARAYMSPSRDGFKPLLPCSGSHNTQFLTLKQSHVVSHAEAPQVRSVSSARFGLPSPSCYYLLPLSRDTFLAKLFTPRGSLKERASNFWCPFNPGHPGPNFFFFFIPCFRLPFGSRPGVLSQLAVTSPEEVLFFSVNTSLLLCSQLRSCPQKDIIARTSASSSKDTTVWNLRPGAVLE